MAGFRIEGNTSGNVAEVDANNNEQVNLPYKTPAGVLQGGGPSKAGFVTVQYELDNGSLTGTRYTRAPFVSEDYRLNVGMDTTVGIYNFVATSQNTGKFKHAFVGFLATQSGGFLNIPATTATSGNYAYMQTWKHFTLPADAGIHMEMVGQISAMPASNQVFECGLFLGTAGTAPTEGVFFRLTSAGLKGFVKNANGGGEISTTATVATLPLNTNGKYKIIISQREVSFWIDDVLLGEIATPAGNAIPYSSIALPMCFQLYNTSASTAGMIVKIGSAHISLTDLQTASPWPIQMACQGNAYQGQDGDTMGSLAIYSNAALAAAANFANTTAATANIGLGGVVQALLATPAAGTDTIAFSYLNPVGSTIQPPKTLVVTGITISAGVQVALVGATNLVFGAAFGHTALSLATTDTASFVTATTKSPRRVALGVLNAATAAPAGVNMGIIQIVFASPCVINPGEYFAITMRNVGTVSATGSIVITACVDHYNE